MANKCKTISFILVGSLAFISSYADEYEEETINPEFNSCIEKWDNKETFDEQICKNFCIEEKNKKISHTLKLPKFLHQYTAYDILESNDCVITRYVMTNSPSIILNHDASVSTIPPEGGVITIKESSPMYKKLFLTNTAAKFCCAILSSVDASK